MLTSLERTLLLFLPRRHCYIRHTGKQRVLGQLCVSSPDTLRLSRKAYSFYPVISFLPLRKPSAYLTSQAGKGERDTRKVGITLWPPCSCRLVEDCYYLPSCPPVSFSGWQLGRAQDFQYYLWRASTQRVAGGGGGRTLNLPRRAETQLEQVGGGERQH